MMLRPLIFLILLAAIIAMVLLFPPEWRSLALWQSQIAAFHSKVDQFFWLYFISFFAVYVLVTSLSIPLATMMSLAAGALFGLLWGGVLVLLAASFGASLAFLLARYLLRDWVRQKTKGRLKRLEDNFAKDGWLYLLVLRLTPIVPFWVVNLGMGLTPVRLWQFFVITLIGIAPASLLIVNAGKEIGKLNQLGDLLSPSLIISLSALALFSLVMKYVVARIKAKAAPDSAVAPEPANMPIKTPADLPHD